jgi:hypothetical protein
VPTSIDIMIYVIDITIRLPYAVFRKGLPAQRATVAHGLGFQRSQNEVSRLSSRS